MPAPYDCTAPASLAVQLEGSLSSSSCPFFINKLLFLFFYYIFFFFFNGVCNALAMRSMEIFWTERHVSRTSAVEVGEPFGCMQH